MRSVILVSILLCTTLAAGCGADDPASPAPGPVDGKLVLVPAGSFTQGAPADEPGFLGEEAAHPVTLTRDFLIFSTEVTNAQYAALAQWALEQGYCRVVGTRLIDSLDGSDLELLDMDDDRDCEISFVDGAFVVDPGRDRHPVVEVRWHGAAAFCDWLSLREGLPRAYDHSDPTWWQCNGFDPYGAAGYRLPTEAEWEYACRAGTQTAFHGGPLTELGCGDEPSLATHGWYCGNAGGGSHAAGELQPNAFGLYDMHGNVWEWCNDWYDTGHEVPATDPPGPRPQMDTEGPYKLLRGGGWSDTARRCRAASRRNPSPHKGVDGRHGFRYVKTAAAPAARSGPLREGNP